MVQKHLITIVTGSYKPTYNWITIVTGANLNQDSLHWGGHEKPVVPLLDPPPSACDGS